MPNENKVREIWVDNVKIIACIFVVLGHFFQSMTKASIIPAGSIYNWFNQTIYTFHVPLFFICSGYLYNRYSKVNSFSAWRSNALKKLINLGIPYFTFSIITLILKYIFSNSVNTQAESSFLGTLFLHPASPYWYLYALFFIFLITPTFLGNKSKIIILSAAVALKLISFTGFAQNISVVNYILQNEIWFVLGMCLSTVNVKQFIKHKSFCVISALGLLLFIGLSILLFELSFMNNITSFIIGLIACLSIIGLILYFCGDGKQNRFLCFLSKYTMPIFLMHTIFAAPVRAVLLKLSINNAVIHIVLGIAVSFIGPIVAAKIMSLSKYLEFFIYPNRLIKIKSKQKNNAKQKNSTAR